MDRRMHMMSKSWQKHMGRLVVAGATAVALSGCTIPFIGVEVPIDLPSELPFQLPDLEQVASHISIPTFQLPIGVRTSVDQARTSKLSSTSLLGNDSLVMPGYLTVGVDVVTSAAPHCAVGTDGYLYGIDVDVAALAASKLGLRVRYVPATDADGLGTTYDVLMGKAQKEVKRAEVVGSYVESASALFHRGEPVVLTATELGGKTIAVQEGSVSEELLDNTSLKISKQTFASLEEAFDSLDAGNVDLVLCEAYPGAYLANLRSGIAFAGAFESPQTAGIAVARSATELASAVQTVLDEAAAEGTLELIRMHWVGTMPTLSSDSVVADIPLAETEDAK
jgi:polar amino acid transport system substrate-binding protein